MFASNTPSNSNGDSNDGISPENEAIPKPLEFLKGHPLAEVAELLGDYMGIGIDSISLMMLISRAAGRIGTPINLAIYSDDPGAENLIADRIINILPESVKRPESIKRIRELADQGFEDTELVLIRSLHNSLFRFATETACRDTLRSSPPSVWLISDEQAATPRLGPTLALMARQTDRELAGFGHQFSRGAESEESVSLQTLRQLVLQLGHRARYKCPFQEKIRAGFKPSESLIFNRTLATIAALRMEMSNLHGKFQPKSESVVTIDDYRVARSLVNALPIPGELSQLSPYAAETGQSFTSLSSQTKAIRKRFQTTVRSVTKHSLANMRLMCLATVTTQ